eukprot:scaffold77482_cov50-Prasinocladus_malaysianus.AAC.1
MGAFLFKVEHPVTEAITGLDLAEEMLRVADDQTLSVDQERVRASKINGWAMESRVYAEDPARNFLPSTGRLSQYVIPSGLGVRCDGGVLQGSEISMHYDPMIAKLVTHGESRKEAIKRMQLALDTYVIRGPEHNVPFLRSVVGHPAFISGSITTAFIPQNYPEEGDTAPRHLPLSAEQEVNMIALTAAWHSANQKRLLQQVALQNSGKTVIPTSTYSTCDWLTPISCHLATYVSCWLIALHCSSAAPTCLVLSVDGEQTPVKVSSIPPDRVQPALDTEAAYVVEVGSSSVRVELLHQEAASYCPDL